MHTRAPLASSTHRVRLGSMLCHGHIQTLRSIICHTLFFLLPVYPPLPPAPHEDLFADNMCVLLGAQALPKLG